MQLHLSDLPRYLVAALAGGMIGYAFGLLQQVALRRNEQREQTGRFKSGWSLMPGAGVRVAYLLILLAVVQLVCPLLFVDGTQWLVSGGLMAGYGGVLFRQLRRRMGGSRI